MLTLVKPDEHAVVAAHRVVKAARLVAAARKTYGTEADALRRLFIDTDQDDCREDVATSTIDRKGDTYTAASPETWDAVEAILRGLLGLR